MEKQIKRAANLLAKVLEWVINSIVLIAIAVAIVSLWDPFMDFLSDRTAKGCIFVIKKYLQIPRRSRDCDEEESGFLCETDEQI